MVRVEVIRRRLEKLDEYISYLEKVRSFDEEEFLNKTEIWASTERFLQMALEAINDMAAHIIAEENFGSINQYRDIPELFKHKNIINTQLKEKWLRMIGFRNILVHEYVDINRSEVYNVLQKNMDDLKALRKIFAHFL